MSTPLDTRGGNVLNGVARQVPGLHHPWQGAEGPECCGAPGPLLLLIRHLQKHVGMAGQRRAPAHKVFPAQILQSHPEIGTAFDHVPIFGDNLLTCPVLTDHEWVSPKAWPPDIHRALGDTVNAFVQDFWNRRLRKKIGERSRSAPRAMPGATRVGGDLRGNLLRSSPWADRFLRDSFHLSPQLTGDFTAGNALSHRLRSVNLN